LNQERRDVNWRDAQDPFNPENTSAGNGGDLVKHSVYLTLLEEHVATSPRPRIRECHAGRGIYAIPPGDPRRRLVSALLSEPQLALAQAQVDALDALGLPHDGCWYAGSALLNARLAGASYEGYEWAPDTRGILEAVLKQAAPGARVVEPVPPLDRLDGEALMAERLPQWDAQDVMLLDPFGIWRRPKLAPRRHRFRRLVRGWLASPARPAMAWFFVWRSPGGTEEMAEGIDAGYAELYGELERAGHVPLVVRWRWDLDCAMWLLHPAPERLAVAVERRLERLVAVMGGRGFAPDRWSVGWGGSPI
jgi:23S rRNA A2030 N6-methylase RlmJ